MRMIFITSVVVRNEYFLHEGINDGAIAHHLFNTGYEYPINKEIREKK